MFPSLFSNNIKSPSLQSVFSLTLTFPLRIKIPVLKLEGSSRLSFPAFFKRIVYILIGENVDAGPFTPLNSPAIILTLPPSSGIMKEPIFSFKSAWYLGGSNLFFFGRLTHN